MISAEGSVPVAAVSAMHVWSVALAPLSLYGPISTVCMRKLTTFLPLTRTSAEAVPVLSGSVRVVLVASSERVVVVVSEAVPRVAVVATVALKVISATSSWTEIPATSWSKVSPRWASAWWV